MAICLGKKWGKLRNAWKCWFLDTALPENPSSKPLPPLPLFWSWTWERRVKWPGIRSLALINVVFKPDFKFQPQQFKYDFPGETVQKPAFSSFSQLSPLFSETYGHQSQSFIHQIKPDSVHFEHLKYEPDLSTHARDKGGVKIQMDCGTPCSTRGRKREIRNSSKVNDSKGLNLFCSKIFPLFHPASRI